MNFDDVVAVKPLNGDDVAAGGVAGACSQDIVASELTTVFGVGASIGSVPPHPSVNCVRNVTFSGWEQTWPIKGI
jgi:hypothetical protein